MEFPLKHVRTPLERFAIIDTVSSKSNERILNGISVKVTKYLIIYNFHHFSSEAKQESDKSLSGRFRTFFDLLLMNRKFHVYITHIQVFIDIIHIEKAR